MGSRNESSAISRLVNIPIYPPEFQVKSNAHLQSYLEAALKEEWFKTHSEVVSPQAKESLDRLGANIWDADRHCMQAQKETNYKRDDSVGFR